MADSPPAVGDKVLKHPKHKLVKEIMANKNSAVNATKIDLLRPFFQEKDTDKLLVFFKDDGHKRAFKAIHTTLKGASTTPWTTNRNFTLAFMSPIFASLYCLIDIAEEEEMTTTRGRNVRNIFETFTNSINEIVKQEQEKVPSASSRSRAKVSNGVDYQTSGQRAQDLVPFDPKKLLTTVCVVCKHKSMMPLLGRPCLAL